MCCVSSPPPTTLLAVRQPLYPLNLTLPERQGSFSEIFLLGNIVQAKPAKSCAKR